MAKNLDELKDELYAAFTLTVTKGKISLQKDTWQGWQVGAPLMDAAAKTAESIAHVEQQIRERDLHENTTKGLKG